MDVNAKDRDYPSGEITKVTQQKRRKDRASVFIDDVYSFSLSFDAVLENGLRKGQKVTSAQVEEMVERDQVALAKSRALHFVAHRPRTKYEVRRKLKMLGYDQSTNSQVITYLLNLHYLDDRAYAFEYVASRYRVKGLGPRKLESELYAKGVDKGIIADAIATLPPVEELLEKAITNLEKKWRTYHRDDESKRKRKAIAFLTRRGFAISTAVQAYQKVVEASEQN